MGILRLASPGGLKSGGHSVLILKDLLLPHLCNVSLAGRRAGKADCSLGATMGCMEQWFTQLKLTQVRLLSALYFPILQEQALCSGPCRTEDSSDSLNHFPSVLMLPLHHFLLSPSVVLPPEKSEGHEGQGQLCSIDDGEKAAGREGPLRLSKKHLNIDVSPLPCTSV